MNVTKESIASRLKEHQASMELCKQQMVKVDDARDQLKANMNALSGAIQELQYQLVLLDKPEDSPA